MSHDQKPPRVRVVNAGGTPAQRRGDKPTGAGQAAGGKSRRTARAATPAIATRRSGGIMLPAGLFMIGSAIGGAALALLTRT